MTCRTELNATNNGCFAPGSMAADGLHSFHLGVGNRAACFQWEHLGRLFFQDASLYSVSHNPRTCGCWNDAWVKNLEINLCSTFLLLLAPDLQGWHSARSNLSKNILPSNMGCTPHESAKVLLDLSKTKLASLQHVRYFCSGWLPINIKPF